MKTKMSQPIRYFRLLGSLLLSRLALFVALLLLAGIRSTDRVAQAAPDPQDDVMSVTFTLDDFDDAITATDRLRPRPPNSFFANQGPYTNDGTGALITDSLTCPFTYSCYLTLDYDVSAAPTSEGGYVEELGYSYTYDGGNPATWRLRDMSHCQALTFRVKGDDILPFTSQFGVEVIGQDWGVRDLFTVTGVTTAWQTKTISLADLTNVDASRIKQVNLRFHNEQVIVPTGRLYFDDIAFTNCQIKGDLIDLIERQTFAFFWELRHPDTGFVPDRAVAPFYSNKMSSIAGIGFEVVAFGIGAEQGWITRNEAASATLQVLDTLWTITPTASHRGFYYHFLDIDTGRRHPGSELSTIDTALLMAGIMFAQEYYTSTDTVEVAIRQRAEQLFNQVEWDWILRTDPEPVNKYNQFYLAWKPECGPGYEFSTPDSDGGCFDGQSDKPITWDYYTDEILLINLLAIGSPSHPVPTDTFIAWRREQGSYADYTLYKTWLGQLFAHFIGQMWLDLRCHQEAESGIIWPYNSRLAALANRQFAIDQALSYTTYSLLSWGLSPSLGPPDDPYITTIDGAGTYRTYAGLPKGETIPQPPVHDGTVAPYAAAGSIMFLSRNRIENEAYQTLEHWYHTQSRLWRLYGFVDSFNLGQLADPSDDWFAHDYLALDQGMTLLALENYQTGFVWRVMNKSSVISESKKAVFDPACYYLPIIVKN